MDVSGSFPFYYVLTAKAIQGFILAGDKLRLMVGGSELIEALPKKMEELMRHQGAEPGLDYEVLSSAAGGARWLFKDEARARGFVALMPLVLARYAPGLEFVQTLVRVENGLAKTMERAEEMLQRRRQTLFPLCPVPGPLVLRAPRSGFPAVGRFKKEPEDLAMRAKRKALDSARLGLREKIWPGDQGLAPIPMAEDFSALAAEERGAIAVVHIDGNGLGMLVRTFFDGMKEKSDGEIAEAYRRFSAAIDHASVGALRRALQPLVEKVGEGKERDGAYPFRPLVCAGDDVTVILRAADAVPFAEAFLGAFEEASREELAQLGGKWQGHPGLTACAGIAFVKKNFPFAQAFALCESLCSFAKKQTKRSCSALAFWRVTTSAPDDFDGILERELLVGETSGRLRLTMMPYRVGHAQGGEECPRLEDLLALKDAAAAMPRGSLRGVLSDLFQGKARAHQSFERLLDVARRREGAVETSPSRRLERSLKKLTFSSRAIFTEETSKESQEKEQRTPLLDALELLSAEQA